MDTIITDGRNMLYLYPMMCMGGVCVCARACEWLRHATLYPEVARVHSASYCHVAKLHVGRCATCRRIRSAVGADAERAHDLPMNGTTPIGAKLFANTCAHS
jgi:hypothetical protein